MEKSLVLIKPDAVEKNIIGKIINMYEENDLTVINLKMQKIDRRLATKHYKEHKGKIFFEPLISFITRGPLCALIIEGEDAIEKIRRINGSSNLEVAEEGTIRRLYASNNLENCVHASDSLESAKREIDIWFK